MPQLKRATADIMDPSLGQPMRDASKDREVPGPELARNWDAARPGAGAPCAPPAASCPGSPCFPPAASGPARLAAIVFHAVSRPPAEQDAAQAAGFAAVEKYAAGAAGDEDFTDRLLIWRGMLLWVVLIPASRVRALATLLRESRLALARGGPVVCTADAVVPCDVRACVLEDLGLDVGDQTYMVTLGGS